MGKVQIGAKVIILGTLATDMECNNTVQIYTLYKQLQRKFGEKIESSFIYTKEISILM